MIFINKHEFYIPANLYDALLHLRSDKAFSDPSFLLWIDLICINQGDNDEKSIQVARMRETYQDACRVIVWLGNCPEQRKSTGRAATFLSDHIQDLNGPMPTYFGDEENAAIMCTIGQHVLRRSWWWRMWVIQEVALARAVIVICDGHHFRWDHLLYTFNWSKSLNMDCLNASQEEMIEGNGYFPNIDFKSMYQWKLANRIGISILELLENASSCQATDPKDMIYSLLGLAADVESESSNAVRQATASNLKLEINYNESLSVQQLYIDFAKLYIRTHEDNPLDVITFSRYSPQRMQGLPSWVPDWVSLRTAACDSLIRPTKPSPQRAALVNPYYYCASRNTSPEFKFPMNNVLSVSGIRFDVIKAVGVSYGDDPLSPDWPYNKLDDAIQDWRTLALGQDDLRQSHRYVHTEQTLIDVFARTIAADTNLVGARIVPNPGAHHILYPFIEDYHVSRPSSRMLAGDFKDKKQLERAAKQAEDDIQAAKRAVQLRSHRRRFFSTSRGFFGLGPRDAMSEDTVFILHGCSVPVVLRRSGDGWSFVGEVFVAGIMDGQAVDAMAYKGGLEGEKHEHMLALKGVKEENIEIK